MTDRDTDWPEPWSPLAGAPSWARIVFVAVAALAVVVCTLRYVADIVWVRDVTVEGDRLDDCKSRCRDGDDDSQCVCPDASGQTQSEAQWRRGPPGGRVIP